MVVKCGHFSTPSVVLAVVRLREMVSANKAVAATLGKLERKMTSYDEVIGDISQIVTCSTIKHARSGCTVCQVSDRN